MHTGIISFCDRVRYNIKSSETKDVILSDLERRYHIRILQRHWYKLDDTTSSQLKKAAHWACLRSNGNPYYMFFTRFDDTNIIYFIDKKVQPGYEKPRIILGRGMFDDDLFDNTILDGEMVKRTDGPGWVFLINDVISYCGRFLNDILLPERISYAYELFHNKYTADPLMDVCLFSVKRYVDVKKKSIDELIHISETLPYTNRGIYFWCHSTKLKPKLYNFDDGLIKSVHRKVKDCPEFRDRVNNKTIDNTHITDDKLKDKDTDNEKEKNKDNDNAKDKKRLVAIEFVEHKKYTSKTTNDGGFVEKILWLRKTENPDIYDVFTSQQCNDRHGNAYVSSLVMSKKLRSIFKDLTVAICVPFKCTYNKQFEKWTPLEQIDIQNTPIS